MHNAHCTQLISLELESSLTLKKAQVPILETIQCHVSESVESPHYLPSGMAKKKLLKGAFEYSLS